MKNETKIRVPKKYQNRIEGICKDSEGYCCYFNHGWCWDDWGIHAIREDTQERLLECILESIECECDCCKGLA